MMYLFFLIACINISSQALDKTRVWKTEVEFLRNIYDWVDFEFSTLKRQAELVYFF